MNKSRNSSIELLKIFAIFLIVISHVTQTLESYNQFVPYQDYLLNLTMATTDVQQIILTMLRYSGVLGNTMFFICSAWFLLDSDQASAKKWFSILVEVWIISFILLAAAFIVRKGEIDTKPLISSLFPITSSTYWYITCYLLFYPIHPFLNKTIRGMTQSQLFRITMGLVFLYMGINFFRYSFYATPIISWITMYFVISYMKLYLKDLASRKKANIALLCIGFFGHFGIILLTNFLGLVIPFFSDKLLQWNEICNPITFCIALALFNLARKTDFTNDFINRFSKLSLLIYILHEHVIFRTYYRPMAFHWIYSHYGYDQILLWAMLLSLAIFVCSAVICQIYDRTFRTTIMKLSELLHAKALLSWNSFEAFALKFH